MHLDPNDFLKHLNPGRNTKTVEFSLRSRAGRGEIANGTDEEFRDAAAAYKSTLKDLVDEWIDSGKDPEDDLDFPARRELKQGSKTFGAAIRWLETHAPRFQIIGGEIVYDFSLPYRHSAAHPSAKPLDAVRDAAASEFVALLHSPMKRNLAKCDGCRKYYFRKKPRSCYKGGKYFCTECKSLGSSKETKAAADTENKEITLQIASAARAKWEGLPLESRPKHGEVKRYIVGRLLTIKEDKIMRLSQRWRESQEIETKRKVRIYRSLTWVSQNFAEIEERAKRTGNRRI